MTTGVGTTLTMGYDGLRRLTSVTGGPVTRQYTYRDIDSTKTTMQVASVTSGGQRYGYTYDSMGNIATFSAPGKGTVTYTYDNQGQLLSAAGDTTYTYTYDGAGNILTASDGTATHSYTYGDTNWKDLLTAFDGQAITYDAIGNPTSYYNGTRWNFTWANGRSLATASDGTNSLSFAYDAGGLRTSKTVNGTTYRYYYAGGKLMRMTWGTNTIDFFYDASGLPYAMKYNGTVYYYITNLQGNVMRIVDASQNIVTSYDYDPYGKVISATGTLANINPLRYRGYVYDQETGFYYVSSRYYDPEIGRWINADDTAYLGADGTLLSYNLFAYCLNNPVNRTDINGNWSGWATAGVIVGAVLCIAAVSVLTCGVGTATLAGAIAVGAAKGALIGAAVGTAAGAGIGYAATGTLEGMATGAAIGFGVGSVVGAIAGGARGGSNYIKASSFLKSNGANLSEVLSAYKGTPKVQTLKADTTVYRTWGGNSGKYGHWVSPQNYGPNAKSMLSLPPVNTAENVSTFVLREGTSVLSGKAAPLFGQAGGGIQWWVGYLS